MKNRSLALFLMGMATVGMSGIKVQADAASKVNNDSLTTDVNETSVNQAKANEKEEVAATASVNAQTNTNVHVATNNVTQTATPAPQGMNEASNNLASTAKEVSKNNFTYYSDLDSKADIYNKGEYYKYENMAPVINNSVSLNDAKQTVNDYANLSDDEMKEVNTFAAQLVNTARESVWKTASPEETANSDWKLVITDKSMALAKKVAEEYNRDNYSIFKNNDHDIAALQRAFNAFGIPNIRQENYGSTTLNLQATKDANRTKTMLDVKIALFKTLTIMLYNDKIFSEGGSNVGTNANDNNSHTYSLVYGNSKNSYVTNYFGVAFDQMGQVHIVNIPVNWIDSRSSFGKNQLAYQATFGNTSGIETTMPQEYQKYLTATNLYVSQIDDIAKKRSNVTQKGDYYFVVTNGRTYLYDKNNNQLTGQQYVDGYWYYFDDASAQMVTGFKYITNQKKTVYYDINGKMQYGQRYIDGAWYNFDLSSGAMSMGLTYIPGQKKLVFYGTDGKMQYTTQRIAGVNYNFDRYSGALLANGQKHINEAWYLFKNNQVQTGFQWIANQHKTVYYDPATGKMQYGQKHINGAWYLFDNASGAMKTGFQWIANQHKTVYYGSDGKMSYGQVKVGKNWYYFDKNSGAMKTGIVYIPDQNKLVYYASNGKMQYGKQSVNGKLYSFNRWSGALEGNGQINVAGKWYFLKNGRPLTGFQRIVNQNKTVYYDPTTAQMVHGQARINGSWYYFDDASGAMKTGFVYIKNQNKTVYYDGNGRMVYGNQKINGKIYIFNELTGALVY